MAIIKAKSGTLTLGASGQSVVLASGASMSGQNYPAFEAYLSADQGLTDGVTAKVNFDGENFDTDSCYDNTTNYRFTPTVAGKYYIYSSLALTSDTNTDVVSVTMFLYKNGSEEIRVGSIFTANNIRRNQPTLVKTIDMNGTTDYLEIFANINVTSGTPSIININNSNIFGAYRIGA